jgi:prefoldin subunit 5
MNNKHIVEAIVDLQDRVGELEGAEETAQSEAIDDLNAQLRELAIQVTELKNQGEVAVFSGKKRNNIN